MVDIKPGDEVICIDNLGAHSGLLKGSIYKVKEVYYNKHDKNYSGILIEGFSKEFFMTRFKRIDSNDTAKPYHGSNDPGDTTYYPLKTTEKSMSEVMESHANTFIKLKESEDSDKVNHPHHYTNHPSGVECIQITEHMNFCLGNAIKYIWRADLKNGVEDLKKAVFYLNREIENRTKNK
jgi:hypothetical protein